MREQTETCDTDKTSLSYLKNSPSLFQRLGEYPYTFEHLTMNYYGKTISAGVETTFLSLISEPWDRTKVFTVGGSQPFGRSGAHLDNTTNNPPVIHSNQATATIGRWVRGDWNISLVSMESHPEVQIGRIGQSSNDSIGMNLLVTIGGNLP